MAEEAAEAPNKQQLASTKFDKLEEEWMRRRKHVINNINVFLSSVMLSEDMFSPVSIPTANINKDNSFNQCEVSWSVLCTAIKTFESILDKMSELINNMKYEVGKLRMEEIIDRGLSGNATSPVDCVQMMVLKESMYRDDCTLFDIVLNQLSWGNLKLNGEVIDGATNDSVDNENESSDQTTTPMSSLVILLEANPSIDRKVMQNIAYHLDLDHQIRRYENNNI